MKDKQNKRKEQREDSVGEKQNAEQETKSACGCYTAGNKKQ